MIFEERERAREEWLSNIRTQSGIALVLTSMGALVLGWVVAGRVVRPVRQITLHAKELSSATLNKRIDLAGPDDELKELADTIDAMLGRLEAAFQSQRHFSAQASHELRTPLSIIRAEADVALANPEASADAAELASRVRAAVERCDGLIDGLLALARSESTMRDYDLLDLAELTGDVVGEYLAQANDFKVQIDLVLDNAPVTGDRALLERLVGNLLDNAIRYNERGGWVSIAVSEAESQAKLTIENSGPRLDSDDVTPLLAPFRRGENSQAAAPGYGLGLAIVRAVTVAHGGNVDVQPRGQGGLTMHISLPASNAGQERPPAETGQMSSPGAPPEAYSFDSPM
ncbi:MAG TPA: HAMP domain-containing sensor histidine kinase [Dehalococcoidia bacterium]|nr:HAMP domain-containing sensor histidine kinase [Dehalococcoidia bacterium]